MQASKKGKRRKEENWARIWVPLNQEPQKQQMAMVSQCIGAMLQFIGKNTESFSPK